MWVLLPLECSEGLLWHRGCWNTKGSLLLLMKQQTSSAFLKWWLAKSCSLYHTSDKLKALWAPAPGGPPPPAGGGGGGGPGGGGGGGGAPP